MASKVALADEEIKQWVVVQMTVQAQYYQIFFLFFFWENVEYWKGNRGDHYDGLSAVHYDTRFFLSW